MNTTGSQYLFEPTTDGDIKVNLVQVIIREDDRQVYQGNLEEWAQDQDRLADWQTDSLCTSMEPSINPPIQYHTGGLTSAYASARL